MSEASCTYEDLVKAAKNNKPYVVPYDWLKVEVKNLNPGDFYVTPLLFWAKSKRPISLIVRDRMGPAFLKLVGPVAVRMLPM